MAATERGKRVEIFRSELDPACVLAGVACGGEIGRAAHSPAGEPLA